MSKGLEVIGIGLSRTSTNSLRTTFEKLGYPCIHGYNFMEKFNESNFKEFWYNVYNNNGNNINWNEFFEYNGYKSGCDMPIFTYWKQIFKYYNDNNTIYNNNIKLILTKRNGLSLYNSWINNFYDEIKNWDNNIDGLRIQHEMCEYLLKQYGIIFNKQTFFEKEFKNDFIGFVDEYNNDVIRYIQVNGLQNRFIVIDLDKLNTKQTIIDICKLMEIEYDSCGIKEYPISNTQQEYKKNFDYSVNKFNESL